MPAAESLTIEITGDSSGLSEALQEAQAQIESLQTAASTASSTAEGVGSHLARVSTAIQPLQQVGQLLSRISQQSQAIGQMPLTLNVQPALSALQTLMSAINAVAASLSALSQPMGGGSVPSSGGGGVSGPSSAASRMTTNSVLLAPQQRAMAATSAAPTHTVIASNSLASRFVSDTTPVRPPAHWSAASRSTVMTTESPRIVAPGVSISNLDQIPIQLTQSLVSDPEKDALDKRVVGGHPKVPMTSESRSTLREASLPTTSTTNHFGGITIEVKETADVNSLLRDLRLQGLSLRHRHG